MNIKQLKARLAQIHSDHKAVLVKLEDDKLSAEDRGKLEAQADALETEFYAVEAQLKRAEKAAKMDATIAGSGRAAEPDAPQRQQPAQRAGALDTVTDLSEQDPLAGFETGASFIRAVMRAGLRGGAVDDRLKPLAGPSTYDQETGSTDGYMVPPAIRDQVWEAVTEDGSELMNLVTPEPTEGNQVQIVSDETTPWGSSGVQANWAAEGVQLNASKLSSKLVDVKLHKLYAFVLATDELLEDAPRLMDRLTRQSARAIAWKGSEAVMNGSGAGQPLGYMNAACLVTVAKDSGQKAATLSATNLGNMLSRLPASSLGRAYWIAHTDIIPQLLTMTIGQRPVFIPDSGTLADKPNMGTILGRPVLFSEHSAALGTKGDIALIDPEGYYATNKRAGVNFAQSMHLYFDYGIQAFRWTVRMGGQPFLSAAIARAHGSNTKSHFVTLAAR